MIARVLGGLAVLLTLATSGTVFSAEPARPMPPLEIAITPYYSTRLMFEQYEPLRRHLEQALGRKTFLVTATDFADFARHTHAHDYRFIFDVPHFGRLAEVDERYRLLLQMKAVLRGTFLVAKDSPIKTLADLRGKSVSTPDRLAIIRMMGAEKLAENGVMPDQDVQMIAKPTHNAAVLSMLNGEHDAALVWYKTIASMPIETSGRLRVIDETEDINAFILFLAAPEVPKDEVAAVRDALLAFAASEAGQAFAKTTGYGHLEPVESGDLTPLDRYLPIVRNALRTAGP